ncbi:MAG: hypothetical protein V4683_11435 [Bacteroidota bacterium]
MEKMIPELPSVFLVLADLVKLKNKNKRVIIEKLQNLNIENPQISEYITANEFIDALRIGRTKFDDSSIN